MNHIILNGSYWKNILNWMNVFNWSNILNWMNRIEWNESYWIEWIVFYWMNRIEEIVMNESYQIAWIILKERIELNELYCIEWIVLNWINPVELNESYWIEWIVLNWMNDELYWIWTVLNDLYWMSHYVSIVLNRIEVYQSVSNSIVQTRYISRSPDMFDEACEDPSRYFLS